MLLVVGPVILVCRFPSAVRLRYQKEIIHELEINCCESTIRDSARLDAGPLDRSDNELIRRKNMKLETFAMRIAWAFASIVVLLVVVSLFMVVAGYAGSKLPLH
jgi:hypothetical protein